MRERIFITVGTIELWVAGLDDTGPYLRIFAKCSLCGAQIHSRVFDVSKGDKVPADGVLSDVHLAKTHKCPLTN